MHRLVLTLILGRRQGLSVELPGPGLANLLS